MIEELLRDFDGERNETDRRIYYQILGRQLIEGEFDDSDSSDMELSKLMASDPQAHAFSYSGYGEGSEN